MKIEDLQDGATMRVLMHMIIYTELVLGNIKRATTMIAIDTLLRAQEGATSKVPSLMNHHLGMPRIVIDTSHLMIIVDHHHLMTTIDMHHHMTIADTSHLMIVVDHHHLMTTIDIHHHMTVTDTSHLMFTIDQHLPRIFDDTPQDMVMMQEDEILDMKRPRLQRTTTPTIWCPQSLAPPPKWHLQDRLHMRRSPMVRDKILHQQGRWCQVQRKRDHISWCFPLLPPPP
jgi:hypothetical protein